METGGQKMPNEWIDGSTGHKIIKLTRREGNNMSFYFHNNPFVGSKMVFYGTDYLNTASNDSVNNFINWPVFTLIVNKVRGNFAS